MSYQINQPELLVELTTEAQQLISGGNCGYSPCYKPNKCCKEYKSYEHYKPSSCYDSYPGFDDSRDY
jgi:hypothetical protein